MIAMGLRYGTKEATNFAVEVFFKTLALNAYRGSVILAKERGAFEIYDAQREAENPLYSVLSKRIPSSIVIWLSMERRNIALLTIAPTGSTGLMTQTSSGIEPVLCLLYMRRRKVNPNVKSPCELKV